MRTRTNNNIPFSGQDYHSQRKLTAESSYRLFSLFSLEFELTKLTLKWSENVRGGDRVNRKLAVTVLALAFVMLTTPYVGMAHAGKGQERLSIRFQIGGSVGEADPGRVWFSPTKELPPELGGDPNSIHMRDVGWGVDSTGFLIVVDEGGSLEETLDDEDITYSCSYDINLFYDRGDLTIKVREMWEIEGRGYIETLAVEVLYNVFNPADFYAKGIFVGHGEIDGQKINLSGEAGTGMLTGPFRIGTVIGWPT